VRIDGQLSGEIEASDAIYIAEEAVVAAQVEAAIIIAGRFEGQVRCRERLEVLASGRATAELTTSSLVVHEGAVIQGMVQMDEARRPAPETTANRAQPDGPAASAPRASRPAHRPESPEPASSTATDQGATASG
jgi:cytoskeletal protein CcmA (bactofilin family)